MNPDEVLKQLDRILANALFTSSPKLASFLSYVVKGALAGEMGSLKEYSIGVEVFQRGAEFDPRIDNIVRVQASKLRAKLLEYYTLEGAQDLVLIGIPKGSYAPEIRERPAAPASASAAAPATTQVNARSRVAVLPFVNMSSDPENEYFSDGLTEEVINRLARIPGLQVVARTSAFRFKGRNEDLREVGAKLSAGTVLEGSVRKSGDQLRVTAQLIDVGSGYHLFSRSYQREFKDVFAVQDEIAQSVADEVAPASGAEVSRGSAHGRAENLEAYNTYLRAMFAMANRFAGFHQCIDLFREAIRLDPNFAPAWAGLSYAYLLLVWFYQMPAEVAMPLCKEAALRTLECDGESGLGNASLALYECGFEWRWAMGESRFRHALELQPDLTMVYPFYAFCCLLPQLKKDEACRAVDQAILVDPFNALGRATATYVNGAAGRYEEALRHHAMGLEINPNFPPILGSAALAHQWNGRLDLALPLFRRSCEIPPRSPFQISILGHALAAAGETVEARGLIDRLMRFPSPPPVDIGSIHWGLKNTDEALTWLERAAQQRSLHLLTVPSDPRFAELRSHPRFRNILREMGLDTAAAP